MARRGFDLSGDLNAEADPLGPQFLFPLSNLAEFSTLLAAGYWFRHRAEIHKRLMLLATVGGLMPAPLAHLIGHFPSLRDMGAIIVVPFAAFLFASAVYDRVSTWTHSSCFDVGGDSAFCPGDSECGGDWP